MEEFNKKKALKKKEEINHRLHSDNCRNYVGGRRMKKPMKCDECGKMISKPKLNKSGLCTPCGLRKIMKIKYNRKSKTKQNENEDSNV